MPMAAHDQGPVIVVQPDEGASHWQPLPSVGYIEAKLTPYNTPYDGFAMGIQVLEPGAHIRRHGHERQHEILFCYQGTGEAEVGAESHKLSPETTVLVGRGVQHKVTNTGATQMRLVWWISPAGLEDWFQAIGKPRVPGEPQPTPFPRPDDVAEIQARMRFIRSEEG
jgi:quercetin dioxygenase-like cupin family protein